MKLGRDPVRTPMPWDASAAGGFTTGRPWLPLNADHATRNVAALLADPSSTLSLYRALIALRRRNPALREGKIAVRGVQNNVLTYTREEGAERILVCLNFADTPRALALKADGVVVLSTTPARESKAARPLRLAAHEGLILRLAPRV
jgi:alpha-glucosidase